MKKEYMVFLFVLAAVFISITAFFLPSLSTDGWWHISSGREIMKMHALPAVDNFYCFGPQKWYSHEWLFDCAAYKLYNALGERGLKAACSALFFITILILFLISYRASGKNISAALPAVLLAIALLIFYCEERPQLITMFSMSLFVLAAVNVSNTKNIIYLYLLAPLAFFWANCHLAAIAGVYVVLVHLSFSIAVSDKKEKRCLILNTVPLIILFLCALAATPLGLKGVILFGEDPWLKKYIYEWQGLIGRGSTGYYIYTVLLISAGMAALLETVTKFKEKQTYPDAIRSLAIIVPFFVAAFITKKVIPILVTVLVPSVAALFGRFKNRLAPYALSAVMTVVIVFFLINREIIIYPEKGAQFIRQNSAGGCVFSAFEWGGYMENELYPGTRIFLNGRLNAPETVIRNYSEIYNIQGNYKELIKDSAVEFYILKYNSPISVYFNKQGIKPVYSDNICLIYRFKI